MRPPNAAAQKRQTALQVLRQRHRSAASARAHAMCKQIRLIGRGARGPKQGGWTLTLARTSASAPRDPLRYSGSFVPHAGAGSVLPQAGAGSAEPQAGAGSAEPQAGAGFGSALPHAVPRAGAGSVVPQPPDTTLSRLLIFVSFLFVTPPRRVSIMHFQEEAACGEEATNLLGTHLFVR